MRKGLIPGCTAELEITVTPEMFAGFEGSIIHPVYSTVSMVYHMEWASRQIILPFLEEHEEGIGSGVSVKHLAPCTEGAVVKIEAEAVSVEKSRITTSVKAVCSGITVGAGEVVQLILPKDKILELMKGADIRNS
ncbi:thioesterase [Bacillus lacus]|uniref:Thioesterase n=1 Tax=Metabacillus lacus TaxID=1983721 RepID=A0A7X2LZL9_9BACI|nr:thioesterase [Metabacillus lacus]MRX71839.1 thioesterase [Metabacillus lacus]